MDEQYRAALDLWVVALNGRGEKDLVEAAVDENAQVERFGFRERSGRLAETFVGAKSVAEWMTRTPEGTVFGVEGPVSVSEQDGVLVGAARYKLEVKYFTGGGHWSFRLAPDGRIAWLAHEPDDVDDDSDKWRAEMDQWMKENPGQ